MNIKEMNALFLMTIKDHAAKVGTQKAAILFAMDAHTIQSIQSLDEQRLREFVEKVDVPIFKLANESSVFWAELNSRENPVDWPNVAMMRTYLSLSVPSHLA